MEHMSLQEITTACGGTYYGEPSLLTREVSGVAIDSRKAGKDFLFVPIKGARVDGHSFIPQVMEQGALCTLSEHPLSDSSPYILVSSCAQALKDIAEHYRRALGIKVVGISGSVGKTSTKEMIASILEQKYSVLKTAGNFNNEIGLPLTVFQIQKEHEVAVLEMGISDFQEMNRLAKIAQPDICVLTNIGQCHLENLGDRDGVRKAKTEMFAHRRPGASIILNGDDDKLSEIATVHAASFSKQDGTTVVPYSDSTHDETSAASAVGKSGDTTPIFFGKDPHNAFYADEIQSLGLKGTSCKIHTPAGDFTVIISIPGAHMVYNALAGTAVGIELGLTLDEIKTGIEALQPVAGRNHMIETEHLTILDDCYNANPVSMKASLDVLSTALTRKVAILGDMFELGTKELLLHREVGTYAAEKKLDLLCCIGTLSKAMADGASEFSAQNDTKICYFETKNDFLNAVSSIIKEHDTILVKASHGMAFEEIVHALCHLTFKKTLRRIDMNYEVLVLDLDGTLTNSEKKITEPTKEALLDIQQKGKIVVLASGRPTPGILPLAHELELEKYGGYVLSFNGAKIINCSTGEVLYNKTIPSEVIRPAYELAKDYDVDILAYSDDAIISGICPNSYTELEARINSLPICRVENFPAYINFPTNKLLISGEESLTAELEIKLNSHFRKLLNIYRSEPFFLEIMPQNIDKAYTLQKLLSAIGLTADQMICCGDGYNDITMLESAGLGVAMANAQPLVREKADYITKSNDEDGVLFVIDQFLR